MTRERIEELLIGENKRLLTENALLRKALEEAPHTEHCAYRPRYGFECNCWKSRIPEVNQ